MKVRGRTELWPARHVIVCDPISLRIVY